MIFFIKWLLNFRGDGIIKKKNVAYRIQNSEVIQWAENMESSMSGQLVSKRD